MILPGSLRSWRSWASLAVFCVIIGALLVACGGGNSQTNNPSKFQGNISVGVDSDIVTLDPLKSSALIDRQVMLNIYDTLVRVDEHNTLQPDLATAWTYTTADHTKLVFTLRTGVTFQDGTPFNADAVVFNINRILTAPTSPRYSELVTVQSVQALDTSHVQFTLKKPFAPLLANLSDRAGMILSPTAVGKIGGANLGNAPVGAGSGPFAFSTWVKGDHLLIKRNPHYWLKDSQGNTLPYLQSISYRPITNESVRYSNLQTGAITIAEVLGSNDVAAAKANTSLIYKQLPGLSFFGVMLNVKSGPLANVHVRRAIEWGVNRAEILNSVLKGVGVVSQGPISPSSWAYNSGIAPYSYNIANAKSELAQAGVKNVTFTLLIPSGSPATDQEAEFILSELQPAGITVDIKRETFAALLSDTNVHNFQAALLGWSGRPDPDGNMYSWFHTGGGFNNMQYSNPQVDALLETARASSDEGQRTTDYQQAEKLILQDASYVFINHGVSIQASATNLKNFTILPTGILEFTSVYLSS